MDNFCFITDVSGTFAGVFVLVPLRRLFILKYRLTYPSGSATGLIINGFHTPLGEAAAK